MARVALAVLAWEPGWSALSWDDFTRVAIAREWAAAPQLVPDLVWLPLPTWVNGAVFKGFGGLFRDNPMLLTAIVNTIALLGTAAIVGWSAYRLFRSRAGSLLALVAVLFSPWGLFTSLSGLGEPIYYLIVAASVATTLAWLRTRRLGSLAIAAACVTAATAARYEGWWLMAAWATVLAFVEVGLPGPGFAHRVRASWRSLTLLTAPGLVPLGWILLNWHRTGDPLFFVRESARYFSIAFGAGGGVVSRATYHPLALVRTAPLLLAAIAVVAVVRRRDRVVQLLIAIVALPFGALWVSAVLVSPVGAFNERFLFAFAIALAPLLGGLPGVVSGIAPRRRRVIGTAAALIAITLTGIRMTEGQIEWTHAPDLLTLTETLGRIGDPAHPLTVVIGPGLEGDAMALAIRNGEAVRVVDGSGLTTAGPALDDSTLWIERLPERVTAIAATPTATVGRYAVYGSVVVPTEPCTGCEGWTLTNEDGGEHVIAPGPYVALEFSGDDPAPGTEASVWTSVRRNSQPRTAKLELRSLYGHGFNAGRMQMQVRVDGVVVLQRDIAARSRWLTVEIPIPAGEGSTQVEVAVVALPGIESGWAWGRASTVFIRSFEVSDT